MAEALRNENLEPVLSNVAAALLRTDNRGLGTGVFEPPPYQLLWRTLTSSFGSNIRARKLRSTKIGNQHRLNPRLLADWHTSLES